MCVKINKYSVASVTINTPYSSSWYIYFYRKPLKSLHVRLTDKKHFLTTSFIHSLTKVFFFLCLSSFNLTFTLQWEHWGQLNAQHPPKDTLTHRFDRSTNLLINRPALPLSQSHPAVRLLGLYCTVCTD